MARCLNTGPTTPLCPMGFYPYWNSPGSADAQMLSRKPLKNWHNMISKGGPDRTDQTVRFGAGVVVDVDGRTNRLKCGCGLASVQRPRWNILWRAGAACGGGRDGFKKTLIDLTRSG